MNELSDTIVNQRYREIHKEACRQVARGIKPIIRKVWPLFKEIILVEGADGVRVKSD